MKRVTMFIVFVVAASLLLSAIVSPIGVLAQVGGSGTGTPNAGGTGVPNTGSNQNGGPAFVNLQTMQGFQVEDVTGKALGSVSDFVINLPKTRIDYIVMAGNNGRQVLVPWSSLAAVDAGQQMFTFYQDGSRLDDAPTFDTNSIDFTDPNWSANTVNYWRFGTGGVNAANGNNSSGGQVGTPAATVESGTAGSSASGTVEPTGQAGNTANNSSAGNNGTSNVRNGAVAVLASTLLNAQVEDIRNTSSFDAMFGNSSNSSNGSSSSTTGTSVPNTGSVQATSEGTSVPNTGSNQANTEAIGSVAGAIVTRINGDIRWILVRPQGSLADAINQAVADANNRNNATANNGGTVPNTGGSNSSGTAQPSVAGTAQPTDQSANQSPTTQATGSVPNTGSNDQSNGDVIPVPFDMMFPVLNNNQLVLRASPFMLRSAPVVASNINNLGFGWDMNINQFWGSGGLQGGRFPLFSNNNNNQLQAGTGGGVPVTGSDQSAMASSAFVPLNNLQGYAIQDGAGNSLGSIQDFVVNIPKTRIDYVVVNATDGRQVLVPWAALSSVDSNAKVFYFRYAGNELQNAPTFSTNDFNFSDPEWDNSVINFWMTGRNATNNSSNNGSSNSNNSSNNSSNSQATTGTPQAGTAVPNTGSSQNNGQSGNQNRNGGVAILASQLVGAPVYDVASNTAAGNQNNGNNNSSNSSNNGSSSSAGTPVATGTVESSTGGSGTDQGTSVPNTGSGQNNGQGTANDVIGTVRGAIVTRLNGNIRYLLIEPAAGIANTGGTNQANGTQVSPTEVSGTGSSSVQTTGTPEASNAGTAQGTSVPNTGSSGQNNGTSGLIPVPFTANMVGNNNGQLLVRVSTFMLRNAPGLSNMPDVLGFGFDQNILHFWNTGSLNNSNSNP